MFAYNLMLPIQISASELSSTTTVMSLLSTRLRTSRSYSDLLHALRKLSLVAYKCDLLPTKPALCSLHRPLLFRTNLRSASTANVERLSKDRLHIVQDIINHDTHSLDKKSSLIYQLYHTEGADLIDDLDVIDSLSVRLLDAEHKDNSSPLSDGSALLEGLSSDIKDWLWQAIDTSPSTLAMVLKLVLDNGLDGKLRASCNMLRYVLDQRPGAISEYSESDITAIHSLLQTTAKLSHKQKEDIKSKLCNYCILCSVEFGRPLVAALLLARHLDTVPIDKLTVERVLLALSVQHPLMSNYQNYTIVKLLVRLEVMAFDPSLYLRLIANMSQDAKNAYFPNILFMHVIKLGKILRDRTLLNIAPLRKLIELNLNFGNTTRATEIWKLCYKYDSQFAYQNIGLFRRLFLECDKQRKTSLLNEYFPRDLYRHDDLFDLILAFYGQNPQDPQKLSVFEKLVGTISPPISRSLLSSMLQSFLAQGRMKEVELLTKAIIKSQGGLTSSDTDAIVKQLLSKADFTKAVSFLFQTDISVSKKGLVRIVQYILDKESEGSVPVIDPNNALLEQLRKYVPESDTAIPSAETHNLQQVSLKYNSVLNYAVSELAKLKNDPTRGKFTVIAGRYLTEKYGSGVGRKLFMNRTRRRALGFTFDFAKFGLPKAFVPILKIDETNQATLLQSILQQAQREKDAASIKWCIAELQKSGFLLEDILKEHFGSI